MKKIVKLLLIVLVSFATFIPKSTFAAKKEQTGVLFNTITGEKIDEVTVKNIDISDGKISINLKGKGNTLITANYIKHVVIEDQDVDIYQNISDNYNINIMVTDEVISGIYQNKNLSPQKKLKKNFDDFSFILSLENDFDKDELLAELNKNDKFVKSKKKNVKEFDDYINNSSKVSGVSEPVGLTATATQAYVYANSGPNIAEAYADYTYVGANMYNINKVQYVTTCSDWSLNSSYISIWASPSASSPLWRSTVKNKMTTTTISVTVNKSFDGNGGGMVAQVHTVGFLPFLKIFKLPIPYFIDDYDVWYW